MGTGAYHLSDMPAGEKLVIICRRCDRRGSYDVPRLMAEHGDIPLPSVLTMLAKTCQGRDSWGGCAALFESPLGSRTPPIVPGAR